MSPRKVRLVVDAIRGLEISQAVDQLNHLNKAAKTPVLKLINSAVANAENNFDLTADNLFIKEIMVDEGNKLKRWMPRAYGRAAPIRKRGCHINVVLGEIVPTDKKSKPKKKIEKPVKLSAHPKEEEGKAKGKSIAKEIKEPKDEIRDEPVVKGKRIVDPRREGKGKHTKIEGKSERGLVGKMFRRKSG